jgi:hypothetical protein
MHNFFGSPNGIVLHSEEGGADRGGSSATDAFYLPLWETFFTSKIGSEVPVLSSLPRHHNSPLAKCRCK